MKKKLLVGLLLSGSLVLSGCVASGETSPVAEIESSAPSISTATELENMTTEEFVATSPDKFVMEDATELLLISRASMLKFDAEGYTEKLTVVGISSYSIRYHSTVEGAPGTLNVSFDNKGQPNEQSVNVSEEVRFFTLSSLSQNLESSNINALAKVSENRWALRTTYLDEQDKQVSTLYYVDVVDGIITNVLFASNIEESLVVNAKISYGENAVAEEILRTLKK